MPVLNSQPVRQSMRDPIYDTNCFSKAQCSLINAYNYSTNNYNHYNQIFRLPLFHIDTMIYQSYRKCNHRYDDSGQCELHAALGQQYPKTRSPKSKGMLGLTLFHVRGRLFYMRPNKIYNRVQRLKTSVYLSLYVSKHAN